MKRSRLVDLFPDAARSLLQVRGRELLTRLGLDTIRGVVGDVLQGINVRNATERLTRRRLSELNAALLVMYLRAQRQIPDFADRLPDIARAEFLAKEADPFDKLILLWTLGLTRKQVQNVLRSDSKAWDEYVKMFRATVEAASADAAGLYGELAGSIHASKEEDGSVAWRWAIYLFAAIGSQTLGIRGSEKSMYGKLFEKLVLAGVLHVLGFQFVPDERAARGVFWLSSRGRKRESDGTAIVELGVGLRFDIGFIGPGNTEISLDKVSRFERQLEIAKVATFLHTFIIVDRIGRKSRIVELAREIDGTIIQMSGSYWPRELGDAIAKVAPGYSSPLRGLDEGSAAGVIRDRLRTAPFEDIFAIAVEAVEAVESEPQSEEEEDPGE